MKLLIDIPEHIYEHAKESSEDSRDEGEAMRAIANGSQQESCGDAISRQAAIRAIEALQRPIMREESNYYQFKFSGMSEALGAVENLPSVTPQPIDKSAMMYEIYMNGVNMSGEYQGCWVRFKDIEKIVDEYMAESEGKE